MEEFENENGNVIGASFGEEGDVSDDLQKDVLDSDAACQLTARELSDIRQDVKDLKDQVETSYWMLAEKLKSIFDQDLYRDWGYDTWKDYIEQDVGFGKRKADYLVSIHKWLESLPDNMREWITGNLGWTKARMLVGHITPENADMWRSRIEGKTVRELDEMLGSSKRESSGDGAGGAGGDSTPDMEAHKKFSFSAKGNQIEVVDMALTRAMELGDTDVPTNALYLICSDFLASKSTMMTNNDYFFNLEKSLGLKIVALRPVKGGKDEVVYGEHHVYDQEYSVEDVENTKEDSDVEESPTE